MPKIKNRDFVSYPPRHITISDEVWEELKAAKQQSRLTWTNFLKDLLNKKKGA